MLTDSEGWLANTESGTAGQTRLVSTQAGRAGIGKPERVGPSPTPGQITQR